MFTIVESKMRFNNGHLILTAKHCRGSHLSSDCSCWLPKLCHLWRKTRVRRCHVKSERREREREHFIDEEERRGQNAKSFSKLRVLSCVRIGIMREDLSRTGHWRRGSCQNLLRDGTLERDQRLLEVLELFPGDNKRRYGDRIVKHLSEYLSVLMAKIF